MALQSTNLVMMGLGVEGLLPLVEDGNHLRWQFDPDLRFPGLGFDLFRRQHLTVGPSQLSLQVRSDRTAALGALFRELTVEVVHDGTGAMVGARLWGSVMAEQGLSSGVGAVGVPEQVVLRADAMDELILPAGATLQAAWGVPVETRFSDPLTGAIDPSWGVPLNGSVRIVLPLTSAGYPAHPNSPNDLNEARARLARAWTPGGPTSVSAADSSRYLGSNFQQLHNVLTTGLAAGGASFPTTPTGVNQPTTQIDPYSLMLLAAIDPNIARILGLLWVDRTAQSGVEYDYLVVGYWVVGTTSQVVCTTPRGTVGTPVTPGTVFSPGGTTTDRAAFGRRAREALRLLESSERGFGVAPSETVFSVGGFREASVVELDTPWGVGSGVSIKRARGERTDRFRIELDAPTDSVTLHIRSPELDSDVVAYGSQGEMLEVTVEVTPAGGGFGVVTVTGSGITAITVKKPTVVLQVCTTKQVPTIVTHAWISYRVAQATPPPLETPRPVEGIGIPIVDTDEQPLLQPSQIRGQHNLAAGVRWPLPESSTALLPRSSVMYHVSRRPLGNGDAPAGFDPADLGSFTPLTVDTTVPPLPTPILPRREAATRPRPSGWPEVPVHYIDGATTELWYAYAIRGVDLFGRDSASGVGVVELRDTTPPSPPTEAEATFVDAALTASDPEYDAELAALVPSGTDGALVVHWAWSSDRYRQAPDAREFRLYWQGGRLNTYAGRVTAVSSSGDRSTVTVQLDSGQISTAMTQSGSWLRVGDEYFPIILSGTGNLVEITVANLRLTRTATGQRKPPDQGRCIIAVGAGETLVRPGSTPVQPADPNFVDYRLPLKWAQRVATVPLVQPIEGQIGMISTFALSGTLATSAWIDNGDGTSTVRTGLPLRRAAERMPGGSLAIGGTVFPILQASDGANGRVTVQNVGAGTPAAAPSPAPTGAFTISTSGIVEATVALPSGASPPTSATLASRVGGSLVTQAGEFRVLSAYLQGTPPQLALAVLTEGVPLGSAGCAWFPGYRAVIANPGLSATAQTDAGAIGISTADERDYIVDPRGDPARTGNEGAVTAPLVVMRVAHGPVATPSGPVSTIPAGQQHIYSSVPDFRSQSFYELTWPGTSLADATYIVYRALDEAVFLRDRDQRRAGSGYYSSTGAFADDPDFAPWFATYAAASGVTQAELTTAVSSLSSAKAAAVQAAWEAWAAHFYPSLSDAAIQALGNRAGNETVFMRLNEAPIAVASYRDTLDGRARNRFLYRVRTLDAAGNQSALSGCSLPIYIPNVVAPNRPTLLEAEGGANTITLRWVENLEPNLGQYRLYRAETSDDAADLRSMVLHKRIAKSPTAALATGEVKPTAVTGAAGRLEFADSPVEAGKTFIYRLVVVDTDGNRSQPSGPVAGRAYRAPPLPPSWVPGYPVWDNAHTNVTLEWSSPHADLESLVERRGALDLTWTAATGWLTKGSYTHIDTPTDPTQKYKYRIKVRDPLGQVNATYQEAQTP